METMGSVFFHLCSQTCPGQGLQAARMWLAGRFLGEGEAGCSPWQVSACPQESGEAGSLPQTHFQSMTELVVRGP